MTTLLRPLRSDDLDAVLALEPVLFGSGAWSRRTYEEELETANRAYLAAEQDGELVGYAGVALDPEWNIMTIGVAPHARRQGIAAALLDRLVEIATAARGTELFLEVRSRDGGAQQLYRNAGFVPVALRRRYYQPEGADAVVMRRRLRAAGPPVGGEGGADASGAVGPFVSIEEAHRAIWSAHPPVVLDVRWRLDRPNGRADYALGHLPGAVYVDLDSELAAPASPDAGRHPLPEPEALQAAARAWGISDDSTVLIYDDWGGLAAARAWWLLHWAGVSRVAIIDGGLAGWCQAGHHLEDGNVRPRPGDVTVRPGQLPTIDADAAAAFPSGGGVLIDARAAERFRGEVEPIDPRAGHVPGAVNVPTGASAPGGWLLEPAELRARYAAVGVGDGGTGAGETGPGAPAVAAYCGSGVTASHTIAVLASLGVQAALFPGSWSQWSADPARPVATGANPAD